MAFLIWPEIHWYEASGIGRKEFKIKNLLYGRRSNSAMAKQLVVCIDNDGYPASLEKRKIYVALRDQAAEKRGMVRVIDEIRHRLSLSQEFFPADRIAADHQAGGVGRGIADDAYP